LRRSLDPLSTKLSSVTDWNDLQLISGWQGEGALLVGRIWWTITNWSHPAAHKYWWILFITSLWGTSFTLFIVSMSSFVLCPLWALSAFCP
jgi:hypothetical protein